jgi:hypothetical protein
MTSVALLNNSVDRDTGLGGALMLQSRTVSVLESCCVKGNTAFNGGGIYATGTYTAPTVVAATNLELLANTAPFGGGLFFGATTQNRVHFARCEGNTAGAGSVVFSRQDVSPDATLSVAGRVLANGTAIIVPQMHKGSLAVQAEDFRCHRGAELVNLEVRSDLTLNTAEIDHDLGVYPTDLVSSSSNQPGVLYVLNCSRCESGTYSIQNGSVAVQKALRSQSEHFCRPCVFGGKCAGGDKLHALPGFWGRDDASGNVTFAECPAGFCCPLGNQSCAFSHCQGNREGFLCGGCPDGFGLRFFSTACGRDSACSDAPWAGVLFAVAVLIYTAVLVLPTVASKPTGVLAILAFFYQVVPLLRSSSEFSEATDHAFVLLHAIDSVFGGRAIGGSSSGVCLVKGLSAPFKVAAGYGMPVCVGAACALWWCGIQLARRYHRAHYGDAELQHRLVVVNWRVAAVRLSQLGYSGVVATSFELMQCRNVLGDLRFFQDATVTCPQAWQLVPLLLVVASAALPAGLHLWATRRRRASALGARSIGGPSVGATPALQETSAIDRALQSASSDVFEHSEAGGPGTVVSAVVAVDGPFAPHCRWWSAVLLYARLVITIVATLVPLPLWRGVLLLTLTTALLALGVWFRPFREPRSNRLFSAGLVLLCLVAATALPSRVQQSLASTNAVFGNSQSSAEALLWLQFVLALLPIVVLGVTRLTPLLAHAMQIWQSRQHERNRAECGSEQTEPVTAEHAGWTLRRLLLLQRSGLRSLRNAVRRWCDRSPRRGETVAGGVELTSA